jgi:DNA modification methylase
MRGNKIVKADFGEWDKWDTNESYFDFVFNVCEEYKRILKPRGSLVLFFSYRYCGWLAYELERRGLFTYRNPIIFNKLNPLPSFRKNGFRSCHEFGVWLVNDG